MKDQNLVEPEKILDGRAIPCSVKHGLIIQRWLDLAVGDHFVLRNDHDPVRMREKFSAEWPEAFTWEHLQNGPDEFRVKITKLKAIAAPDAATACCCGD